MRAVLYISDMECPTCVKFLETLPLRLAGVNKASANLQERTLRVDFDEAQLTLERILAEVSSYGYHPVLKG